MRLMTERQRGYLEHLIQKLKGEIEKSNEREWKEEAFKTLVDFQMTGLDGLSVMGASELINLARRRLNGRITKVICALCDSELDMIYWSKDYRPPVFICYKCAKGQEKALAYEQKVKETKRETKFNPLADPGIESVDGYFIISGKWANVRLKYRTCGKEMCPKCNHESIVGHGPYYYAEWREGNRIKTKYIGKRLSFIEKLIAQT